MKGLPFSKIVAQLPTCEWNIIMVQGVCSVCRSGQFVPVEEAKGVVTGRRIAPIINDVMARP